MSAPRRVVVLRGREANPWELRAWDHLDPSNWSVDVLVGPGNKFDVGSFEHVRAVEVGVLSGRLPANAVGSALTKAAGDRYLGLEDALRGAAVVHAAELGFWPTAQAVRHKHALGFRLVATAWETIPFRATYRNVRTRRLREHALRDVDRWLPTTHRAARCLALEGVDAGAMEVCPPGIDVARFAPTADAPRPQRHLVLSVGRLVWEKGHADVLRALAQLRRDPAAPRPELLIVGRGPQEAELRRYAADLGVADQVRFAGFVPYDEVPALYARASALVLASLPTPGWEEQFGMVLAEAMAARLAIVAASSGAIPEVVGASGTLVAAGDWPGLAAALRDGPLAGAPAARREPEPDRLRRFSAEACAERLDDVYRRLLAVA